MPHAPAPDARERRETPRRPLRPIAALAAVGAVLGAVACSAAPGGGTEQELFARLATAADLGVRETRMVSVESDGRQLTEASGLAAISGDGRVVAFARASETFLFRQDVYVVDLASGAVELISEGGRDTGDSSTFARPALSADGQLIAYSERQGLGDYRVFVRDRASGIASRVPGPSGENHDQDHVAPSVSGDGRYVAFRTLEAFWDGSGPFRQRVVLHDRTTGSTTTLWSSDVRFQSETPVFSDTADVALSADGRFIAYGAHDHALDPSSPAYVDIHLREIGLTERVSVALGGAVPDGDSGQPAVSADGRFVAFTSQASNLVEGDANGHADVFVRDRLSGTTQRVSVRTTGGESNGDSSHPAISADGRFIAFESRATNLVDGAISTMPSVFVHDRQTGITHHVSVSIDGAIENGVSGAPELSADGSRIVFASTASNLSPDDTNDRSDVFLRRIDVSGPAITIGTHPSPADGANGWFRSDVAVSFEVTDDESPVDAIVGCEGGSVTADTEGATFDCEARSIGGISRESVTIRRDTVRPTVTGVDVPEANEAGWFSHVVTIRFQGSDPSPGSGIWSCSERQVGETTFAGSTVTGTCVDRAGNVSDTVSASVRVDLTPPVVRVTGIEPFGIYETMPAGGCETTDELSGVAIEATYLVIGGATGFQTAVCIGAEDVAGNRALTETVRFTVLNPPQGQVIAFDPLPDRTFGDPPFDLTATATSGLPISYAAHGTCAVEGSTVTITGAGPCAVTASQPGNTQFAAAADVTRSFEIAKAAQTITFLTAEVDALVVGETLTVVATGGGSGAPIAFTSLEDNVCDVVTSPEGTSATATAIGIGTCTVTADQEGNGDYLPAPRRTLSVPVIYGFSGFRAPFAGDVNDVSGLRPVVLRFAVMGASGPDALVAVTTQPVTCDAFDPTEDAAPAPISGAITFDTDTATFRVTVATERSLSGTCRAVRVLLDDGMEYGSIIRYR